VFSLIVQQQAAASRAEKNLGFSEKVLGFRFLGF